MVEAAEVRGGDEVGQGTGDGADAEQLRKREADEDLVEELRWQEQQGSEGRGGGARRGGVVVAGEVVVGHGRGLLRFNFLGMGIVGLGDKFAGSCSLYRAGETVFRLFDLVR